VPGLVGRFARINLELLKALLEHCGDRATTIVDTALHLIGVGARVDHVDIIAASSAAVSAVEGRLPGGKGRAGFTQGPLSPHPGWAAWDSLRS